MRGVILVARALGRDEALSVVVAVAKRTVVASIGAVGGVDVVRGESWDLGVSMVFSLGLAKDSVEWWCALLPRCGRLLRTFLFRCGGPA